MKNANSIGSVPGAAALLGAVLGAAILGAAVLVAGCTSTHKQTGSPADNPLWIDVRTPREFHQGHAEDAILIPYTEIAERIQTEAPNPEQDIRLYCRSGRRSSIALRTLQELGYQNVTDVGGLEDARRLRPFGTE